jgi:hypothetical protein
MILFCLFLISNILILVVCQDCSGLMNCSGHGDCVLDGLCSCHDGFIDVKTTMKIVLETSVVSKKNCVCCQVTLLSKIGCIGWLCKSESIYNTNANHK